MKLKILRFLDPAIEYLVYGLIFFLPISIAAVGIFSGLAVVLFLIKQILSPDFSSIKSNKTFFLILLVSRMILAVVDITDKISFSLIHIHKNLQTNLQTITS